MKTQTIKTAAIAIISALLSTTALKAQISDSFTIYYTKTVNVHKGLGNNPWMENMKKMMPKFLKTPFILTYKNGVSHYRVVPSDNATPGIPAWMMIGGSSEVLRKGDSFYLRRELMDLKMLVHDSVIPFTWKITGDKRNIAGYECRKAVARFQDSILIYAFFSEELNASCGPEVVGGLPGAILGLGIPKLNSTWFADKVELHSKNFTGELPPVKKEKSYNMQSLRTEIKTLFENRWTKDTEKVFWGLFF
jgi:GLPGLI family protein